MMPPDAPLPALLQEDFVSQQVVSLMEAARERQPIPPPQPHGRLSEVEHLTLKAVRQLAEVWRGAAGPDDLLVMLPGTLERSVYARIADLVKPARLWVSGLTVEKPPNNPRPAPETRYYLHACEPMLLEQFLAQATQMKMQLVQTF